MQAVDVGSQAVSEIFSIGGSERRVMVWRL